MNDDYELGYKDGYKNGDRDGYARGWHEAMRTINANQSMGEPVSKCPKCGVLMTATYKAVCNSWACPAQAENRGYDGDT